MVYCDIEDIKVRMLIESTDTQYDDSLNDAANEATNIVDMFLKPYEDTLPLNDVPNQIVEITADLGASVFKRRYFPTEVSLKGPMVLQGGMDALSQMDASGWFALGKSKLELYIRNYYVLAENLASIYNPEVFIELLRRGVITGKEARMFINNATALYSKKVDQLTIEKTENLTTTKNETVSEYHTKRQKHIAFISGDSDTLDKYKKDSETDESEE
jgi:hypothetical protein